MKASGRGSVDSPKQKVRVVEFRPSRGATMPALEIGEVLSFLKETKGQVTWTVPDMVHSLKISRETAREAISILELQGYVKAANGMGDDQWLTTIQGEMLSGATAPRFTPQKVKEVLSKLADRMKVNNRDRNAEFRISEAVAFGDFLSDRSRVQAADVGIKFEARNHGSGEKEQFLKQLRARSPYVHLIAYQPWMSRRSHLQLI